MNRCQTKALLLNEVTVWVGTQTRADHFQYEAGLELTPPTKRKWRRATQGIHPRFPPGLPFAHDKSHPCVLISMVSGL